MTILMYSFFTFSLPRAGIKPTISGSNPKRHNRYTTEAALKSILRDFYFLKRSKYEVDTVLDIRIRKMSLLISMTRSFAILFKY